MLSIAGRMLVHLRACSLCSPYTPSNNDASTEPQASNSEGQQPHGAIGSHSGDDDLTKGFREHWFVFDKDDQKSPKSSEGAISGAESPDEASSSKKEDAGSAKNSWAWQQRLARIFSFTQKY
ncbi:hypothetical protein BASA62_007091 [Batrachochytrium salamandrivorans]|nr:hypothetical protein BASA62_007091 [Batrachochytrium salamandrivorans]